MVTSFDSYEIGYAAETGWRVITEEEDAIPPFDYVEKLLLDRIRVIQNECFTTIAPRIFITKGRTFRFDIAKTKPYKGQRVEKKPWHFNNLTAYLIGVLGAEIVETIEADDRMAIEQTKSNGTTIICSRDKDLRQVPGWFYSWELGNQPSFGPVLIDQAGTLEFDKEKNKLTGTGLAFFYSQLLTGDAADNIPGLPKCGPVKAWELLKGKTSEEMLSAVETAYKVMYKELYKEYLQEQSSLLWLLREEDNILYIRNE